MNLNNNVVVQIEAKGNNFFEVNAFHPTCKTCKHKNDKDYSLPNCRLLELDFLDDDFYCGKYEEKTDE